MITSGTVLIEKDALHPQCFQVQGDSRPQAWMPVKFSLTPRELEKELSATGWTFFFLATVIKATAFGFDRARATHEALKRVIETVRRRNCNCLQILRVEEHAFLGIPCVSVSAHPRHIQKGMNFLQPTSV